MKAWILAVAIGVIAAPAFGEAAKYGTALGCAGVGSSVDVSAAQRSALLSGDEISFGEYSCQLPHGHTGRLTMSCSGEGDTWKEPLTLSRKADGSFRIVHAGDTLTLAPCKP